MTTNMKSRLIYLLIFLYLPSIYCEEKFSRNLLNSKTIVKTTSGRLKGRYVETANGNNGYVFLDIPYALPPVGQRRFERPVSLPDFPLWHGIRNATEYGHSCYEVNYYGDNLTDISENCLTVNVFSGRRCMHGLIKCSVLYYYIGGNWMFGSPSAFPIDTMIDHFASKDIVYVTVNYRTNAFGFLRTPDGSLKGNLALWDGIESLRWIQNEIRNFGGNPKRVTMMGHSSGAQGISLLSLLPEADGLYNQAVVMSSSAFENNPVGYLTSDSSENITRYLNCTPEDFQWSSEQDGWDDVVDCLKNADPQTVADVQLADRSTRFGPRIDGELVPTLISKLAKSRKAVPYLIGITSNETALNIFTGSFEKTIYPLCEIAVVTIKPNYMHLRNMLTNACVKFYAETYDNNTQKAAWALTNDIGFTIGVLTDAQSMAKMGAPVYLYQFDYTKDGYGFAHSQDLNFLMGINIANLTPSYTEDDRKMAQIYLSYFVNFVKHGNPTPNDHDWEPLTNNDNYYSISLNSTNDAPFGDRSNIFWNIVAPSIFEGAMAAAHKYGLFEAKDMPKPEWVANSTEEYLNEVHIKLALTEAEIELGIKDLLDKIRKNTRSMEKLRDEIIGVIESILSNQPFDKKINTIQLAVVERQDLEDDLQQLNKMIFNMIRELLDASAQKEEASRHADIQSVIQDQINRIREAIRERQDEETLNDDTMKKIRDRIAAKKAERMKQIESTLEEIRKAVKERMNETIKESQKEYDQYEKERQAKIDDIKSKNTKKIEDNQMQQEERAEEIEDIMNKIKNKINESIEEAKLNKTEHQKEKQKRIDEIKKSIKDQINEWEEKKEKFEEELNKTIDTIKEKFQERKNEIENVAQQRIDEIKTSIKEKIEQDEKKEEEYEKKRNETISKIKDSIKSVITNLNDTFQSTKNKIESAENSYNKSINAIRQSIIESIEEAINATIERNKLFDEIKNDTIEDLMDEKAKMNQQLNKTLESIRQSIKDELKTQIDKKHSQTEKKINETMTELRNLIEQFLNKTADTIAIKAVIHERLRNIEKSIKDGIGKEEANENETIEETKDEIGSAMFPHSQSIDDALNLLRDQIIASLESRIKYNHMKREKAVAALKKRLEEIKEKIENSKAAKDQDIFNRWFETYSKLDHNSDNSMDFFDEKNIMKLVQSMPGFDKEWIDYIKNTLQESNQQVKDYHNQKMTLPKSINLATSMQPVGINYQIGFYVVTGLLIVVIAAVFIYAFRVARQARAVVDERSPLIIDNAKRQVEI